MKKFWPLRLDSEHRLEVSELQDLALASAADLVKTIQKHGEQATVIVAVATDNDEHSRFGLKLSGSCLRLEGLASVVQRSATDSWKPEALRYADDPRADGA